MIAPLEQVPTQGAEPNRGRLVLVTIVGVYPIITALLTVFAEMMAAWPMWMRTLVVAPLMVVIMTYVVQPLMMLMFRRWIFSDPVTTAAPELEH
jgi:antibiotic biosynthesis monooxygenase (ABM) superfamily enzyme